MADADSEAELVDIFDRAAEYLKTIAGKLDSDALLKLYARFKQAREGPCNIPKPGYFDFQGKQKWEAWKNLGDMGKNQAMDEYVAEISKIAPNWEKKICKEKLKPGNMTTVGAVISTMSKPDDEEIMDENKTVFDWVKDGNLEQVKRLLDSGKVNVNEKDDQGMFLLHWACDRGYSNLVELLAEKKADVNIQDADGQTPLHYACSCEHESVVKLLLKYNADPHIPDVEGSMPAELTTNQKILNLFLPT